MHRNGICHRDLKLENVLLQSKDGLDVKVIDFGLSRINASDQLKTRIGTPYYVAPEVIMAEQAGSYTSQCDMWSLGVIVFFMLYGHPPFHAESDAKLFVEIVAGQFEFPKMPEVSSDAKDFIRGLLTTTYERKEDHEGPVRMTAEEATQH